MVMVYGVECLLWDSVLLKDQSQNVLVCYLSGMKDMYLLNGF